MIDASRTTLTLCNGGGSDLLNPSVDDIDWAVLGEHLAKANRYCGATPGVVYSVAEHAVRCSRAAFAETDDILLAAYLLHHDDHEALLGDDTTPKKRALASIIESFGVLAGEIEKAFASLTDRIDIVIHAEAGLPWPPAPDMQAQIKHWDRVLLATEWRDMMPGPPPYDFGVTPLPDRIVPEQDWRESAALYTRLVASFLPIRG